MECFDVSHIQGSDPVASMVVFVDGQPDKASYRSFKVAGVGEPGERQNDDFASMYEVLTRRLRWAIEDEDWALPDLLIIDGGKGQLGRVIAAMQDMGIALGEEGCDVVGLAKERSFAPRASKQGLDEVRQAGVDKLADYVVATANDAQTEGEVRPERVFVPGAKDAIALAKGSSELYLMTRIRDEAHRFAITHHRKRRSKRSLESVLDGIKGVGPAIKRKLVLHFNTVKAIREASVEQLSAVDGIGPKLAETIHAALRS
jgi:excinuclease ABC subunit C